LWFAFPAGDNTVGRYLRDYGEFSRVLSALAGQLARGRTFLDVGANIGSVALPVARLAAHVIAIEAHAGLAQLLAENASDNGLANVEVIHAAAAAEAGTLNFPTAPFDTIGNFGGIGFGDHFPLQAVPAVTLDSVAPADIAVVKIDVEGHEPQVLAGASHLLTITRPVWIIESPDTVEARDVIRLFLSKDYRVYWFFTPFFTPTSPRNGGAEQIRGDMNIVAVSADQPQPTDMVRADLAKPRPNSVDAFPYLARFGFSMPRS
jgi:FkbM family methyltransferase